MAGAAGLQSSPSRHRSGLLHSGAEGTTREGQAERWHPRGFAALFRLRLV